MKRRIITPARSSPSEELSGRWIPDRSTNRFPTRQFSRWSSIFELVMTIFDELTGNTHCVNDRKPEISTSAKSEIRILIGLRLDDESMSWHQFIDNYEGFERVPDPTDVRHLLAVGEQSQTVWESSRAPHSRNSSGAHWPVAAFWLQRLVRVLTIVNCQLYLLRYTVAGCEQHSRIVAETLSGSFSVQEEDG